MLEAEYYCIEEIREAVQRALGGVKFEDDFSDFNVADDHWKEMNIRTHYQIDHAAHSKKNKYEGFPMFLQSADVDGRPALRALSVVDCLTRR